MAGCAQGLSNDILTKTGVYAFSNSCNRYTLDETININDYLKIIQKKHREFKEEYESLEKINLGKSINIAGYTEDSSIRGLRIKLNSNEKGTIVPGSEFEYLDIFSEEGRTWAQFITKYEYSGKVVPLKGVSEEVLNNYLELFFKYRKLFELDMKQNRGPICSSSNIIRKYEVSIRFNTVNGSLINGLTGATVEGNYVNSKSSVNFTFYTDFQSEGENKDNGYMIDSGKSIMDIQCDPSIKQSFDMYDVLRMIRLTKGQLLDYDLNPNEELSKKNAFEYLEDIFYTHREFMKKYRELGEMVLSVGLRAYDFEVDEENQTRSITFCFINPTNGSYESIDGYNAYVIRENNGNIERLYLDTFYYEGSKNSEKILLRTEPDQVDYYRNILDLFFQYRDLFKVLENGFLIFNSEKRYNIAVKFENTQLKDLDEIRSYIIGDTYEIIDIGFDPNEGIILSEEAAMLLDSTEVVGAPELNYDLGTQK